MGTAMLAKNTNPARGTSRLNELAHAAQDRAGLSSAKLHHGEDREEVSGKIGHRGGNHQGPGPREAIRFTGMQRGAAARAVRSLLPGHDNKRAGFASNGPSWHASRDKCPP